MKNDVVSVQIRGILPANSGCALFVGNDDKVFVINVEPNMGAVIGMFLRETPKERPLTHDLIQSIFKGFSISVERVVITDLAQGGVRLRGRYHRHRCRARSRSSRRPVRTRRRLGIVAGVDESALSARRAATHPCLI